MLKRSLFAAVLLASVALPASAPASAQDIATRIFQMEERIRQLTGQVEELTYTVNQLQTQLGQKQGNAGALSTPPAQLPVQKQVAAAPSAQPPDTTDGIEVIQDAPVQRNNAQIIGSDGTSTIDTTPAQVPFKKVGNEAADGTFAGQVLVPENGGGTQTAQAGQPIPQDGVQQQDGIEQVSLQPPESPDELYKSANEALLRRQFGEAEAGFRSFLAKYPEHSLAGSAQYWLGETFYVQGDSKQAAQNFLQAYKTYPKSRRAPDSLLKLGMSLNKMGQKEQACAAFNSVGTEFPRAVEAKKRADAEYKRVGC
jgi:tol-pal system protein YbgF